MKSLIIHSINQFEYNSYFKWMYSYIYRAFIEE
jgi:hypothetical protein